MATKTLRAPYKIGDKFKALFYDPQYGTCLGTFTVTECFPKGRDSDGNAVWEVQGRAGERFRFGFVRSDGTDRHGYIERAS